MQSFHNYLENRQVNELIKEAANLCVELDVHPAEFIMQMDFTESDLHEQGFFNRLGQAAKQFAGNVWSGGGLKGGFAQAKDTLAGPSAKYTQAIKTLEDLTKALASNAATAQMKTSNNKTPVTQFLQRVIGDLKRQQQMIPQMAAPQNTQPMMQQPGRAPTP